MTISTKINKIEVIGAVFGYSLFPYKTVKKSADTEEGNTTEESINEDDMEEKNEKKEPLDD